jgi:hypothetical protein
MLLHLANFYRQSMQILNCPDIPEESWHGCKKYGEKIRKCAENLLHVGWRCAREKTGMGARAFDVQSSIKQAYMSLVPSKKIY